MSGQPIPELVWTPEDAEFFTKMIREFATREPDLCILEDERLQPYRPDLPRDVVGGPVLHEADEEEERGEDDGEDDGEDGGDSGYEQDDEDDSEEDGEDSGDDDDDSEADFEGLAIRIANAIAEIGVQTEEITNLRREILQISADQATQ